MLFQMTKASLNYKEVHPQFKLNGILYDFQELKEVSYSLIKEGKDHEIAIGNFLMDWLDDNPTVEVQTSGSTGKPKKILLQKQHMVNSAMATGDYFRLEPGNTALLCLSAEYIAGKMMLVRALILGLKLDYVEPTLSPLGTTSKNYDFCAMVPIQAENSFKQIGHIKTLIVGGAPISFALKSRLQKSSCAVFETYGMTETITHVAVKSIDNSHFMALPEVIFSKDSRQCLVIDAPKISDIKVVTNDLVDLISETEFEWLGRYDNVINSGGLKLFPERIEAKLSSLLSNRFFVAGLPDEKLSQKLVLVIEGEIDDELLIKKMDTLSSLGKYEIPKAIYKLPKFLETATGKILRMENINLIRS